MNKIHFSNKWQGQYGGNLFENISIFELYISLNFVISLFIEKGIDYYCVHPVLLNTYLDEEIYVDSLSEDERGFNLTLFE